MAQQFKRKGEKWKEDWGGPVPDVPEPDVPEEDNAGGAKKQKKGGRPSLYREDMPERVYRLALLGLTNSEIAMALGVTRPTLFHWLKANVELRTAIVKGRDMADANVARSLYKRACGYVVREDFVTVRKDAQGNPVLLKTTVEKTLPPDTTACIYWLNNRTRETKRWTQSQKMEVTGPGGGPVLLAPAESQQLAHLSTEELKVAADIGMRLLEGGDRGGSRGEEEGEIDYYDVGDLMAEGAE